MAISTVRNGSYYGCPIHAESLLICIGMNITNIFNERRLHRLYRAMDGVTNTFRPHTGNKQESSCEYASINQIRNALLTFFSPMLLLRLRLLTKWHRLRWFAAPVFICVPGAFKMHEWLRLIGRLWHRHRSSTLMNSRRNLPNTTEFKHFSYTVCVAMHNFYEHARTCQNVPNVREQWVNRF